MKKFTYEKPFGLRVEGAGNVGEAIRKAKIAVARKKSVSLAGERHLVQALIGPNYEFTDGKGASLGQGTRVVFADAGNRLYGIPCLRVSRYSKLIAYPDRQFPEGRGVLDPLDVLEEWDETYVIAAVTRIGYELL